MKVTLPCGVASQLDVLEDFAFKRRAEAFCGAKPPGFCGLFKFGQRIDSKRLVQFEDLVWAQTRDGQNLEDPLRDLFAHTLKCGIGPGRVDAFDDAGDGLADAGNFPQAILSD